MGKNGKIRVWWATKSREFKNPAELAAFVEEMLAARGHALSPLDHRCLERHRRIEAGLPEPESAAARNGDAPDSSPYDEAIREAEARMEDAIAARMEAMEAWQEAKRDGVQALRRERNEDRRIALYETWRTRVAEAEGAYMEADERESRARARRNSLALARDDWRACEAQPPPPAEEYGPEPVFRRTPRKEEAPRWT